MMEIKLCSTCGRYRCDVLHEQNKPDVIRSRQPAILLRTTHGYPERTASGALTGTVEYLLEGATVGIVERVDRKGRHGCHRRLITDGRLFAWADAESLRETADARACADCMAYSHVSRMVTKADGRVICESCQKIIETRAREKAQGNLFVGQPDLF